MFRLPTLLAVLAAIGLIAITGTADAEEADQGFTSGSILVRARGLAVLPDVGSSVSDPVGGKVSLTDSYAPEVDVSYFVTPNIAFELIAATTRHGASVKDSIVGETSLGSVWLLPPTLTAQWHFLPKEWINPYLGGGINYTFFYNATNGSQHSGITYDNNVGYALQAGVDFNIGGRWYANLDVKKLFLSTKVHVLAANSIPTTAKVDIDPWLVGVGLGYRF